MVVLLVSLTTLSSICNGCSLYQVCLEYIVLNHLVASNTCAAVTHGIWVVLLLVLQYLRTVC